MGFTIAFLLLFCCYLVAVSCYLHHQKKKLRDNQTNMIKEKLIVEIKMTIRNLFYISILMLIFGIALTYRIENLEIEPWHIGLGLAVGTLIFFLLFLYWDITKPKILNYFLTVKQIELDKEVISGIFVNLTISAFAFLLIQCTLSIIYLFMA
ncbi:MAG: hypothetical protein PHP41_01630 [Bacilli bacterium]|jgi:hypothetical protein|nr:hypothetical protein [Bacilli bacterium]MDY0064328.1 hypothetical protein [Bacilli bacterium]